MQQRSKTSAVLTGGSIAGTLDIVFAMSLAAYNGMAPLKLLQTVASGWLGQVAFDGGVVTAVLGLASHFALSFLWAALLVFAAARAPALVRRPLVCGVLFGIVVFVLMRLVVLPLSAFPFPVRFRPLNTILDLLSHMFLFATPIVLYARQAVLETRQARSTQ